MKILPGLTPQAATIYTTPSTPKVGIGGGRTYNGDPQVESRGIQGEDVPREGDGYARSRKGARPMDELTRQELQELLKLKQRDQEVRRHEMAHIAAGGPYVRGGAHFEYKKGPDGRRYAVAGEVSIDTSPEEDPRATLQKMRTVQRAALAPAHPSQQDRRVAAQAAAKAIKAMVEIMKEAEEQKVRSGIEKGGPQDQGGRGNGTGRLLDTYL